MHELTFIEVFVGTARLCTAVRKHGLPMSFAVDKFVPKHATCTVLCIDLLSPNGASLLWQALQDPSVVALHLAPPCNTATRARERPIPGGPRPLRSTAQPDGLDGLSSYEQQRVAEANRLYHLSHQIFQFCHATGILVSCENPGRSHFRATSAWSPSLSLEGVASVFFHHCTFGSERDKYTRLDYLMPRLGSLHKLCDKNHTHAPWGLRNSVFATAQECPYPTGLCKQYAALLCQQLLDLGAGSSPDSLLASKQVDQVFARAASNVQPRHKRLPPLLPRFKVVCKLLGPAIAMPRGKKLLQPLLLHDNIAFSTTPFVPLLPAGSRILGSWPVTGGQAGPSASDMHDEDPISSTSVDTDPVVKCSPRPLPCVDPNANGGPISNTPIVADPIVRFSPHPLPCSDPNVNPVKNFGVGPHSVGFSPLPSLDENRLSGFDLNETASLIVKDANCLARDSLSRGDFTGDTCLTILRRCFRNPVTKHRSCLEGANANYFVLGAFVASERKGVTAMTRDCGYVATYLIAFMTARYGEFEASSIAISHNELASLRRDFNSPGTLNITIGLGDYKGGELWVSGEGGSVPIPCKDKGACAPELGFLVDTKLRPYAFDGKTKHATMSWEGDRWVLTFYVVNRLESLGDTSIQCLASLGFPLPRASGEALCQVPHPKGVTEEAIVGVAWDAASFMSEAAKRGHPKHVLHGLLEDLCDAIKAANRMSECDLCMQRTAELRRWFARARELREKEVSLRESLADHLKVVLKSKKLLLMGEMLAASGYKDTGLHEEIAKGFSISGPIPSKAIFKPCCEPATLSVDELRAGSKVVRRGIIQAAANSVNHPLAEEIHSITMDEVKKGWLQGPIQVGDLPPTASVTRRFGVSQSNKTRPIDDFSESLINQTTARSESITPQGLDFICAALVFRLRDRAAVGCASRPMIKTTDLRKAYKQLGLSDDGRLDAYIAVANPASKEAEVYACSVLPFGASASVGAFCRTSHALWHMAVVLLRFHWSIYCDDYFSVSEPQSAKHMDMCIASYFSVLGWEISSDKDLKFDHFAKVLGVKICMKSATLFEVINTQEWSTELVDSINSILSASSCTRKELSSLKGRLQFAEGQIFGRRSFMHMKLIGERALGEGKTVLDQSLRDSLVYMRDRVISGPPREVMTRLANTWFLYTDACYEANHPSWVAGLGGVLVSWYGKPVSYFSFRCTDNILSHLRKTCLLNPIYILEGLAALLGLRVWTSLIHKSHVVAFLDNEGVLGTFMSCRTSQPLFTPILQALTEWESNCQTQAWFDFVPSEANVSDPPSRGDCTQLAGVTRVDVCESDVMQILVST